MKNEIQLDVELDYYGDQSDVQPIRSDASNFEKARNKVRKEARDEWQKSTKLREAVSYIKSYLAENLNLHPLQKPHKVVVYCEFLSALDILAVALELECPDQPILRIDGQTSSKSRNDAIDDFMQDPKYCIMLVTVNSGSEAIVSSADYVLFLHPIWNPAQVQQCIGRAYRHGQTQQVKARVLVARESIETYVYKIQDQKRKKDLLLKTPVDSKTMQRIHNIRDENEFLGEVLYPTPLLFKY